MDINKALNEVLVKLFRNITTIEEQSIRTDEFKDVTANDLHVIEAIGIGESKNMTTVAKSLTVTTGTLTISVNGLVKKGYVERIRSEEDRRIVLISLTEKGERAFDHHQRFHEEMVKGITERLSEEEKVILAKSLNNLSDYFKEIRDRMI
ncbi:MAG: MarR family transcriptional regulator [Lachnospiraceae bacterium]|nr:MarR family transcriptional regulator [Lachnospiraceae bacterium]